MPPRRTRTGKPRGRPRKYRPGMYFGRRRARITRALIPRNEPNFTETYHKADGPYGDFVVNGAVGLGKVFKVQISDITQYQDYAQLYKQYRINWVKVIVIPDFNSDAQDVNQYLSNQPAYLGSCRVVYSIQDSPNVTAPVNEAEVLTDNGCKIKTMKSKWSCSFKPVPDVAQSNAAGNPVYTRQKMKQWFNFDTALVGNNPEHGAVAAYFSMNGAPAAGIRYHVYYKVNFSLRDPQ